MSSKANRRLAELITCKARMAIVFLVGLILCAPCVASASGDFHGHARFEKIKGDPSKGYVELYEYKAFLSPNGSGTGYSYHVGDPGTAIHPGHGCITFSDIPAGTYSLLTCFPEFFPRGKVVSGVVITDGMQTNQDADEPIDYSGYYTKSEWDPSGSNPIYQTFTATGSSIVRASFAKADSTGGGEIEFSIHKDAGGAVETWPQVGPTRSCGRGGYGADHWVGWQAGEVPTLPGQTYAVRLFATNGIHIQPYWSDDSFYPLGTGFRGGQAGPAGHDYYVAVFSDSDDTRATLIVRSAGIGPLEGWYERWAQAYTAHGTSLAGAALFGSRGGSGGWDFSVRVKVREGTPDGPQVGPTKTMPCAFAPFFGLAGVSYSRGEVPTTAGRTYWIVYEAADGGGFSASRMNEGELYAGGTAAHYNGSWSIQAFDLCMNIYEWTQAAEGNGAAFEGETVPASLPPAGDTSVTVTVRNTGTTVWTRSDLYRLGATEANDMVWSDFADGGYCSGPGDCRAYLAVGEGIAPGAAKTFSFRITAPSTPGSYTFACRMVQDTVEWFGSSLEIPVVVEEVPCPYGSLQARMQRDVADHWGPDKTIGLGREIRLGIFHDGSGMLADDAHVELTLSGPSGYAVHPENGAFVSPPYPGDYILTGTCGAVTSDTAVCHVEATAEFILDLIVSYSAGTLGLDFTLGAPEPAAWANYLILTSPEVQVIPLWTVPLPAIDPPMDIPVSFPFPGVGLVGIYTGLFTAEGPQAVVLEWVDSGW